MKALVGVFSPRNPKKLYFPAEYDAIDDINF